MLYVGRLIEKAELGENYASAEGNEGVPVIKMGNLDRGFVKLDKVEYLIEDEIVSESMVLKEGDFLFNTRNSLDLVGKVAIWRGELSRATYNSNILRITFNSQKVATSAYMNYFFNSDLGLSQLRSLAKGTTSVAAVYWKDLTSFRVLLPPPAEQQEIVALLDNSCAQFDRLIADTQCAIDLLQERRNALISAAVTGKIDVRNVPSKDHV
jgi:type I restriction enzyme S subunit